VTYYQYETALSQFLDKHGRVAILEMDITPHIGEPSTLYENRDFAIGKTTCLNEAGERLLFLERWALEGRVWYTRSTGFVTPALSNTSAPRRKTKTA
jgi:hypothetical protein